MPDPHDSTPHWRHVPANGGVQFLFHIDVGNHFNVLVIILQDVLILCISAKIRDAKSVLIEFKNTISWFPSDFFENRQNEIHQVVNTINYNRTLQELYKKTTTKMLNTSLHVFFR